MIKEYKFPRNHFYNPIDDLCSKLEKCGIDLLDIVTKINLQKKIEKPIKTRRSKKFDVQNQILINIKKCSRCGQLKENNEKNFYTDTNGNLKSICKTCLKIYSKIKRKERRDKILALKG